MRAIENITSLFVGLVVVAVLLLWILVQKIKSIKL